MKSAIYMLPTGLLFIALCRMVAVKLHTERRAMFFFLLAWFAFSLAGLLIVQARGTSSPEYARAYFWLSAVVWLAAAPALAQANRALTANLLPTALATIAPVLAVLLVYGILQRTGATTVAATLLATTWIALVAGSVFFFASFAAEDPDRLLWRCAGLFFLVFGGGTLAARAWAQTEAAYLIVVFAGAAVWLALAWFIAPTGDAIFNDELLALSPNVPTPSGAVSHRRRADLTGTSMCRAVQCRMQQATTPGERPKPPLPDCSVIGGPRG